VNTGNSQIKRFLKRRDRLLTVVGAIIVFVTFIIREGAREHLKEVADLLGAAQTTYTLLDNIAFATTNDMSAEAFGFMTTLNGMLPTLQHANWDEIEIAIRQLLFKSQSIFPRFLSISDFRLQQLSSVTEVLKNGDAMKLRISMQWKRVEELQTDFAKMPHLTSSDIADPKNKKVTAALEQFIAAMPTCEEFLRELLPLQNDVVSEARKEKEGAERWYTRCTWASYFLYTLGWGLGLIGKVYGVGVTSGDNDR
jgi:hypothetical protein